MAIADNYPSMYDVQIEKVITDINDYRKGIIRLKALLKEYGIETEEVDGGTVWKRS